MKRYPIHDKDGFIEFVTGVWFHTREIAGPPTIAEIRETLHNFPAERQNEVIMLLDRHGQVDTRAVTFGDLVRLANSVDCYHADPSISEHRPVNWAERLVA